MEARLLRRNEGAGGSHEEEAGVSTSRWHCRRRSLCLSLLPLDPLLAQAAPTTTLRRSASASRWVRLGWGGVPCLCSTAAARDGSWSPPGAAASAATPTCLFTQPPASRPLPPPEQVFLDSTLPIIQHYEARVSGSRGGGHPARAGKGAVEACCSPAGSCAHPRAPLDLLSSSSSPYPQGKVARINADRSADDIFKEVRRAVRAVRAVLRCAASCRRCSGLRQPTRRLAPSSTAQVRRLFLEM